MVSKAVIESLDEQIKQVGWDARAPLKARMKEIQKYWQDCIAQHQFQCSKESHNKCPVLSHDDKQTLEMISLERRYNTMIREHIRLDREKRDLLGITPEEDFALRDTENRLLQSLLNPNLMSNKHDREYN